ncbi:MAG: glycoside hydrolase family 13 [Verrucomicrobia bacterium]|nr:glycoside hydrolase family 13 [Verrucomicrobiota bacterium]
MHSSRSQSSKNSSRYSAKNFSIPVNFSYYAPDAERVSVIGDFNEWRPDENLMELQPDGAWTLQVLMCHGHHHYQFLVDGEHKLDPRAQGIGRNERNERVSLIAVS